MMMFRFDQQSSGRKAVAACFDSVCFTI